MSKINQLSNAIKFALFIGATASLASVSAFAQEKEEVKEIGKIEVTGSRIRRSVDEENAQPVLILTKEDIANQGLTSAGDVLQKISSSGATLNTTYNNGGNGETRVDLRNLGSNRTLVLVNGKRWVSTIDGAVDLNTIPVAIIERVEVLKDGASALYGSDAVGGVINIITSKSFDGAEASAYYGQYAKGDGATQAYDATIGAQSDRFNVVLNGSYVRQDPVFAGDREISRVPLFGIPGTNVNAGASSTTREGRFDWAGNPSTTVVIPGSAGCATNAVCAVGSLGVVNAAGSQLRTYNANTDGFNFAPENYLSTPQDRQAMFAQGSFDFNDKSRVTLTGLYNQRKSAQFLAPMPLTFGTLLFGPTGPNSFDIAPNSVYNPIGLAITRAQVRMPASNPRLFSQDVDTTYFSAQWDSSFTFAERDFYYDIGFARGETALSDVTTGLLNLANVRTAVGASFIDPVTGRATCGTAAAPIAGCVPLNLFGGIDGVTQEMFNYITFTAHDTAASKFTSFTANVNGELFELPAGPLGFALGFENRRQSAFDSPDAFTASGLSTGNIRQPTSGGYDQEDIYLEFAVPIVKDVTGFENFQLNLAVRRSDYSNFGTTTNAKYGFEWKVFSDLLIRANYADSFRAPSVDELFLGTSDAFVDAVDPCNDSNAPTGLLLTRCQADGVIAGYEQANSQLQTSVGGNQLLQPEIGKNKTLGFVYSPSWAPGLNITLDWYNIVLNNAIGAPSAQSILDDCYISGNPTQCALISRAPGGDITDIFAANQNLNSGIETEGLDLNVSYRWETESFGKFGVRWDTSYVDYYGDVGQKDFLFCDGFIGTFDATGTVVTPAGSNAVLPLTANGSGCFSDAARTSALAAASGDQTGLYLGRGAPIWKVKSNISFDWSKGDWAATLGLRYTSSLKESCATPIAVGSGLGDPSIANLCSDPLVVDYNFTQYQLNPPAAAINGVNKLGSRIYADIQGRWKAPWDATISVGIRNVTDRDPPVSYTVPANSFEPAYDIPNRFWYMSYEQRF
jgi:iron complex outermembrane recepter protein